jgi:hypothetical protein
MTPSLTKNLHQNHDTNSIKPYPVITMVPFAQDTNSHPLPMDIEQVIDRPGKAMQ